VRQLSKVIALARVLRESAKNFALLEQKERVVVSKIREPRKTAQTRNGPTQAVAVKQVRERQGGFLSHAPSFILALATGDPYGSDGFISLFVLS
jgi:hypothetical protein